MAYDLINDRLMSPVFFSILLIVLQFILFIDWSDKNKFKKVGVLFVCVLCILSSSKTALKDLNFSMVNGVGGYQSVAWKESKLVKFLEKNKIYLEGTVYTNDVLPFYLIDKNMKPINILQQKLKVVDFLDENQNIKNKNRYLVYFNNRSIPEDFNNELKTLCEIIVLENDFQNGSVSKIYNCKK